MPETTTSKLADSFTSYIQHHYLFTKSDRLLIAVSGGIDSVVLCHLCKAAGFNFAIAHCNFQLRGADSRRDEIFVQQLSVQLKVPFYVAHFPTKQYAAAQKLSTQVAARRLRYDWFEQIRAENGYNFVLTAHHADDNIETVVMNFFRGTGIRGLTGIQARNGNLRRPLLFARRSELEDYVNTHKLPFVQDASNLQDDYTRNYFRNTILPMITRTYPEVQQNLTDNISRFNEVAILYQKEVSRQLKKLLQQSGEEWRIPVLLLQKTPAMKTVLLELIKPYHFQATQLNEVVRLLDSESGKYIVSSSHRILKDRRHLIISPLKQANNATLVIDGPGAVHYAEGTLHITQAEKVITGSEAEQALLDEALIQYPLLLRPWRPGDYFYPLGMKGKKKLAKFFIDQKLSLADKEKVWVLEMNRKIIWVIGYRIDDRFKVTDKTLSALKIEWMRPKKKPAV